MEKKHLLRLILAGALLAHLGLLAAGAPARAAGKEVLTIPAVTLSALPAWVAAERGYFTEQGLQIEVRRMRPDISIKGMIAGEVVYATAIGSVVRAAVTGVPVKAVMAYLTSALGVMMTKPEWKTIESLRGEPKQIIGTESVGGTMEYMQRQFLRHFKLEPGKDVVLRVVGFAEQRAKALQAKVVDATIVIPPQDEFLKEQGFNEVVFGPDIIPEFLLGGLGTTVKKITEDREGVKKAIRASLKATNYINTESAGTIDIIAQWFQLERRYAEKTFARLKKAFPADGKVGDAAVLENIELASQRLKDVGKVPVERVVDFGLLNEVLKETKR
ncbi:MAG: ABC transporter substrate-binding protein [Candidatus Tectomicrobia bacterium]|nr:ABC transporter substrate-binding protein [Candidatus Tectomicrobia bacterium]